MTCPICYQNMDNLSKFTFLCFHSLCKKCYRKWREICLKSGRNISCPICRKIKDEEELELKKDEYFLRYSSVNNEEDDEK